MKETDNFELRKAIDRVISRLGEYAAVVDRLDSGDFLVNVGIKCPRTITVMGHEVLSQLDVLSGLGRSVMDKGLDGFGYFWASPGGCLGFGKTVEDAVADARQRDGFFGFSKSGGSRDTARSLRDRLPVLRDILAEMQLYSSDL